MIVVVATQEEYRLAAKRFPCRIIKTGVGYGNVYRALEKVNREEPIINIGFAGSNVLPVGKVCSVGRVRNYHPGVIFDEPEYKLCGKYPCYTACDFVTETEITEPCLFDMELYAILSMRFKNVVGIKIVSDNLNQNQYERSIEHV